MISATAGEQEIARLLSSAHEIETIFSFTCNEVYTEKELRKRYKRIALLVHPDKNKFLKADSAFQILNNALEVLLSRLPLSHIRCYSDTVDTEGKHDSANGFTSHTTERSTAPSTEPSAEHFASSAPSRHQRTTAGNEKCKTEGKKNPYESVNERTKKEKANSTERSESMRAAAKRDSEWAAAEEEFLSENTKKKVSQEVRRKRKMMERSESERVRAEGLQEELEQREKGVEGRASSWKQWQNSDSTAGKRSSGGVSVDNRKDSNSNSSSSGRSSSSSSSSGGINIDTSMFDKGDQTVTPEAAESADGSNHICLLCRRQFQAFAALQKHENLSELHRQNVVRTRDKSDSFPS